MRKRNYSVYVNNVDFIVVNTFIGKELWYQVRVRVYQEKCCFEGMGFASSPKRAEDLAKKQALRLIGVRYYIRN